MIRYNKELKQNVLDELAKDSQTNKFEKLSKKYNIAIRTIKKWYYNKKKELNVGSHKKTFFQYNETQMLSDRIIEKSLEKSCCLCPYEIKCLAKEVVKDPDFKASNGWYFTFMKKSDLKEKIRIALFEASNNNLNSLQNINSCKVEQVKQEKQEFITQNEEANNTNSTNQVRQYTDQSTQTEGLKELISKLNLNEI